ncbi:uncharacterized protein LOC127877298 isoform X2 [Dreissena polymorpha]|nr:uncharacterized protein LOC127877298 isoform X2 [Dreissena polymorpha]XP_052278951.1 uncharacterized protein LOC127877298 isoform X2 [Dreissena polymorpha]XP_052278952.1 uncharacterized protein LOC127877298 isoform X2 [Dreissena polymorpha]XP_052278954.1 uncharacterized protein LOC127877298 isoform X2 [Dreissena polymorpha]
MTRFARFGERTKKPEDASSWADLKRGSSKPDEAPKGEQKPSSESIDLNKSSILNGVKKDKQFKSGNNAKKSKVLKKGKFGKKGPVDYSSMDCYNCKQKGHKASECSAPSDGKQAEFQCYNCKEKGHKSFNCPKPNRREMKNQRDRGTKGAFPKFNKSDPNWKEQRSELRRLKRQKDTENKKLCFHCRESGHQMSDCPEMRRDVEQGTGICFKCGSTEHAINKCNVKLAPGEFPFAKCFICGETGHLSRACPDNPRGLYPNGGCCKQCGSVEHLKRDCPEFQKQQGISSITLGRITEAWSIEAEETRDLQNTEHNTEQRVKPVKQAPQTKKIVKIVKF